MTVAEVVAVVVTVDVAVEVTVVLGALHRENETGQSSSEANGRQYPVASFRHGPNVPSMQDSHCSPGNAHRSRPGEHVLSSSDSKGKHWPVLWRHGPAVPPKHWVQCSGVVVMVVVAVVVADVDWVVESDVVPVDDMEVVCELVCVLVMDVVCEVVIEVVTDDDADDVRVVVGVSENEVVAVDVGVVVTDVVCDVVRLVVAVNVAVVVCVNVTVVVCVNVAVEVGVCESVVV